MKVINVCTEKQLEDCREQRYVKTKYSRPIYDEMINAKYSGIVYNVKKKLAFHAPPEFLELEAYVGSDGSYNE